MPPTPPHAGAPPPDATLHRRGAYRRKGGRMPVPLNGRISAHLRRWLRLDEARAAERAEKLREAAEAAQRSGAVQVGVPAGPAGAVSDPAETPALISFDGALLSKLPETTFRSIREDAGLGTRVKLSDLRRSTGAHLARRRDVQSRSSACLLGIQTSAYLESFGHLRPDFQEQAVAALMARPATLRHARR